MAKHNVETVAKASMQIITRLEAENTVLRDALVKAAVMKRYRPAGDGTAVFLGLCCETCDADCGPAETLTHKSDCPLSVLNP